MRILRYIFGPVEENGTWRKRYKIEVYKLFTEPYSIRFVKVKSLEWAGHLICASKNRMIKRVFDTKPEGNK
jgi:hypothetical protein